MKRNKKGIGDEDTKSLMPQDERNKKSLKIECHKLSCFMLTLTIVVSLVLGNLFLIYKDDLSSFKSEGLISGEVRLLYEKYDLNSDGIIDLNEFEPLAHKFLEAKTEHNYDEEISDDDEFLTLNAYFEPLDVTKLNINKYEFLTNSDSLKSLKNWKEPNRAVLNFGCKDFKSFLPQNINDIKVGHVWDLIPRLKRDNNQLSNKRFNPPEPETHEKTLFRLLQMFHKKPFLLSRFAPQGTSLVLRAKNKNYLDIFFRVHAEFQLNEPPYFPFWFTPAQFNGRIIIAKNASHIEYFNLYLPNSKKLNIDMEWLNDMNENMEVDIGFVNRMEIVASMSSLKSTRDHQESDKVTRLRVSETFIKPINQERYENMLKMMKWDEEMSESDALIELEKSFYPFKQITYYPFLDAFKKAQSLNKLVHYILLWGALDDQSC
ncbi:unnamed protein product [Brachionus calyciflorus]|uniref:EF-hand domain-containing protein n=1 Tax=Brachionus calyciflorus TaxID=104777 RepID=A0A814H0H9_9BILA|nr:unnamed protein product [Brachionus calyciflorus]